MTASVLPIAPAGYAPSALHQGDRIWLETNCYVDLWIEILNSLGLDPVAALSFTTAIEFEGDQFTFFKFPIEDLRELFGIEVYELALWRPLEQHVEEQAHHGRLLIIEADSYFLPDTFGSAYRTNHVKTSIATNSIDIDSRYLEYFHNAGYHVLEGDDFDGVFRAGLKSSELFMPPYVELVRLDRLTYPSASDLREVARRQLTSHLERRRPGSPIEEFAARFTRDLEAIQAGGVALFHDYAFATLRQLGANCELAGEFARWYGQPEVAENFVAIAQGAKSMQFKLARFAAGRAVDFDPMLHDLSHHWDSALADLTP